MMLTKTIVVKIGLFIPLLMLLSMSPVFAQGQGGGGSSSGSGQGDQSQDRDQLQDGTGDNCINSDECDGVPDQDRLKTQDRDQLQDGTGDGVPDQDRTQDRDQLQDTSLSIGDESIQDRDQLRDRLRDQLQDPDQDRDQDRIRANDSAGLEEVITTTTEVSDDVTGGLGAEIRELSRNQNRVEVGVMAFIAAQNMIGQEGQKIAGLAQEIHATHKVMAQEEEQIQSRGFMRRLFFGGDSDRADLIQEQLQQNTQRMQQIRDYLTDCDCDEQVRTILQEQIKNMGEEHVRLQLVAEDEASAWGLFSWRF